jgi:hypothetical protein
MANSHVIKSICRRIEDRFGSGKAAAMAAGVSAGVWSNYCSDEPQHVDTTIPFHRVFFVANASERAQLAALLVGDGGPAPADILTEAAETTEAAADLQHAVRTAEQDGKLTRLETRVIRAKALAVQAEAGDVIRALDGAA